MFQVGQRVVCVDDSNTDVVTKGTIYTVSGAGVSPVLRLPTVCLVGVTGNEPDSGMYASRFRPIVERKTDISIFTAMLRPAKAPQNA